MADVKFSHVFTRERPGSIEDFYIVNKSKLGSGSYGSVHVAKKKDDEKVRRAIKCIMREKIKQEQRFEEEVAIQQSLDHPNIVKLYEVFKDHKCFYLAMELCTGGELFDRIIAQTEKNADKDEGMAFSEKDAAHYMKQILGAINYLHHRNFVHRDIKPENFLMENETDAAQIKVIDFGLAKKKEEGKLMYTQAGTPYYVAPEVLSGKGYDEKCDVWSCGVICYILMSGYPPFYGDDDKKILKMVRAGDVDFPSPDWDGIQSKTKKFILSMLTKDYTKRPSFDELLENEWIKQQNSDDKGSVIPNLGQRIKQFRGLSKLKKLALTCIATQLDDKAMEDLITTFRTLDVNGDGTLTVKEILDGMQTHNVSIPDDLSDTLKSLDTDGSGSIDYSEFIAATISTAHLHKEQNLWNAFRLFDVDGDGKITYKELQQVIKDSSDIADILKEADYDGDGEISFEEFKRAMRSK